MFTQTHTCIHLHTHTRDISNKANKSGKRATNLFHFVRASRGVGGGDAWAVRMTNPVSVGRRGFKWKARIYWQLQEFDA